MTDLIEGVKPQVRRHWHSGQWHMETGEVVEEIAVTLFVNGQEYVTVALTPLDLRDWVTGFLAGEGLIEHASDITVFLWRPEDGQLWVRVPNAPKHPQKGRYLGSCCGQSRPGFFEPSGMSPLQAPLTLHVEKLQAVFGELSRWSHTQHSGGLHVAGLTNGETLLLARADVGRHNALDKLYGAALARNPMDFGASVILFSGRLSAEIIWKTRLMGCPAIVSNAAPTSLGLRLAEDLGITAVGFLRDDELSVFTHPERIVSAP
ncbi:formate dehydrogenase accessory sulfurtransferase FdhD [Sulfobacillus harzensis]|uniref:Sulfur carrier protein FdhD n=1 Tax=Sulfobacillus harzensis TaxID=2729629 RepID=A0A7Y0L1U2_9FIRM|nr:formate dehydrogenase accessory sulfurtransferase FdhD [Sulfobacillus harzensis]NMP21191.1 formate dehydrogenase accessory sulfurtransferase FdhD [Sulfobacillus harzensis]